jgi:hypothetical protein
MIFCLIYKYGILVATPETEKRSKKTEGTKGFYITGSSIIISSKHKFSNFRFSYI